MRMRTPHTATGRHSTHRHSEAYGSNLTDGEMVLHDEEVSYWTSSDLADAVDADTKTVGNSCLRLFNKSLIAKADVHGGPVQERATFCLWARNVEQFC